MAWTLGGAALPLLLRLLDPAVGIAGADSCIFFGAFALCLYAAGTWISQSISQGGMDALNNQDPLEILAYQYDLVCNGVELSSGAVRNHDPEIMIKAFELVGLGEADVKAKFPAMYNAFCYGAPPHAGIAPGVDRMIMLICGEESIREIIPFPMNKNAMDIMMGAPGTVEQKQLDELHIETTQEEEA